MCFTAPETVLRGSDVYSLPIYLSGITNAVITTPSFTLENWRGGVNKGGEKYKGGGGASMLVQAGKTSIRREDVKQRDHRGVQRDLKHRLKAIW